MGEGQGAVGLTGGSSCPHLGTGTAKQSPGREGGTRKEEVEYLAGTEKSIRVHSPTGTRETRGQGRTLIEPRRAENGLRSGPKTGAGSGDRRRWPLTPGRSLHFILRTMRAPEVLCKGARGWNLLFSKMVLAAVWKVNESMGFCIFHVCL